MSLVLIYSLITVVQEEEEVGSGSGSGSDEDSDGPKLRSSGPLTSKPVPLGWPKACSVYQTLPLI